MNRVIIWRKLFCFSTISLQFDSLLHSIVCLTQSFIHETKTNNYISLLSHFSCRRLHWMFRINCLPSFTLSLINAHHNWNCSLSWALHCRNFFFLIQAATTSFRFFRFHFGSHVQNSNNNRCESHVYGI